jgi:hypothetical protein
VAKLNYLGTTATNEHLIQGKIKSDYIRGMPVIEFQVFCLQACNLKAYQTVTLPVVLYGCET